MDLFLIQTSIFRLYITLIDGLECCLLIDGLDYCDVFISCLDSHSDGTHSLQRIHCWASDGMLNLSKSVLIKKQTHLHLGWPEGMHIFSKISFLGELFFQNCSFSFGSHVSSFSRHRLGDQPEMNREERKTDTWTKITHTQKNFDLESKLAWITVCRSTRRNIFQVSGI